MTLCTECRHYSETLRAWDGKPWLLECNAINGREHPITGTPITGIDASMMRMTLCGWTDPKLFEPKDAKR